MFCCPYALSSLFLAPIKRLDCRNKLVSPCRDYPSVVLSGSPFPSPRDISPTSGTTNKDLKEDWTKRRALQKEVSRMGQHSSKIPFISIMHHFLKQTGVNVSRDQLNDCYHILLEHNSWFPEEGTLDLDIWKRVKNNVLQAYWQGSPYSPSMVGYMITHTGCHGANWRA